MKANELLNTWAKSGTEYAEFAASVKDITDATEVVLTSTDDVAMYHVRVTEMEESMKLPLYVYCKQQVSKNTPPLETHLLLDKYKARGLPVELIKETCEQSHLLMQLCGGSTLLSGGRRSGAYFTSPSLSRDLAARAKLAGDAIYDPTEARNAYIMSRYVVKPQDIKAVVRNATDDFGAPVHKVFALPTVTYTHIPQTAVTDIADALTVELGDMTDIRWYIDHFWTKLKATFMDKAKDIAAVYHLPDSIVPGIYIETSDTGDCALRVYATWQNKYGRALVGAYQHEHRGRFNVEAVAKDVTDRLLEAYTKMPERLCELMTIDIPDPADAVEKLLKTVTVEEGIGTTHKRTLKTVLGAKTMKSLISVVVGELPMGPMNAYDLAMMLMSLPAHVTEENVSAILERAAGNIPFLDFEKVTKKASTTVTLKTA